MLLAGGLTANAGFSTPFSSEANPLRYAAKAKHQPKWVTVKEQPSPARSAATPDQSMTSQDLIYLDGPDGTTWFATVEYDTISVPLEGGYRNDTYITGYHFTIYNSDFNVVGEIKDEIELQEGEKKPASIMLNSVVSKKFFNLDEYYEFAVSVVFNKTDLSTMPTTNVRTFVYSLGGAKDENGNDTVLETIPGYPIDYVNVASDAYSEDYYISFFTEEVANPDDYTDYTEYLNNYKHVVTTYKKASWGTGMSVLDEVKIPYTTLPGDGMSSPFFMLSNVNGKLNLISTHYEKSFFIDPTTADKTEDVTPDNNLIVTVRELPNKYSEIVEKGSLKMPTTQIGGDALFTFYSIGQVLYDGDVDFEHFTTDGSPAFIVTRDEYTIANDDDYISSYYVVDSVGNTLLTLGERVDNISLMSDVKGYEPQVMFVYAETNNYTYDFIDLYSGTSALTMSYLLDDEIVTTSLDRVATKDGYLYAASLRYPDEDSNNQLYHKIGWITPDGEFDHIDRVNLGTDIAMAQVYMVAEALDPYLVNTDANAEYFFLVKRYVNLAAGSSVTREELNIYSTNGQTLLTAYADENKGTLASVMIIPGSKPSVGVIYYNDGDYTADYYTLPLVCFAGGEGTETNPYLIETPADLQQIKTAPSAYYKVNADIDCAGFNFTTIADFAGKLNGANHKISNLTISGSGIFANANEGSVIDSLIFVDPVLSFENAEKPTGLIAGQGVGLTLNNVTVYGLKAVSEDFDDEFGALVGRASLLTSISGCYVAGANIDIPGATTTGGIVGNALTGSTVKACAFVGNINAGTQVGGVAGSLAGDAIVSDCHVNAYIIGANNIGGVVGYSLRGTVSRNYVEGTITANRPNYNGYSVGGVVGYLDCGTDPENSPIIVNGNIVAISSITTEGTNWNEEWYPGQFDNIHRIVGYSAANLEPEVTGYDETTWTPIYSEDVKVEGGLAHNYVTSELEVISETVADGNTTTEGESISRWNLSDEFLGGLGYLYGNNVLAPWNERSFYNPTLWFENCTILLTEHITTHVGETFNIVIRIFNPAELTIDDIVSDMSNSLAESVQMTGNFTLVDNIISFEMIATEVGVSNFSFTLMGGTVYGTIDAQQSGIENITADKADSILYNGSELVAEGTIELYNISGVRVATGEGTLSTEGLATGVYIARTATASLKIAVK